MKIVSTISVLSALLLLLVSEQPTYPIPEKAVVSVNSQVLLDSIRRKNMITLFEIKDVISTQYQLKAKR